MCVIVPNFVKIGRNGLQTSEKVSWGKGQKPQIYKNGYNGAVRGHSRSLTMSPLLDHTISSSH